MKGLILGIIRASLKIFKVIVYWCAKERLSMEKINISVLTDINNINSKEWDSCACPEAVSGLRPFDPFTTHRFLSALEASNSVGRETGWIPNHLVARKLDTVVGVIPLYVKTNSQGEYIFDHNWAHAYTQAGGHYYPKFQVAVPFTPVTGRRILTKVGFEQEINPLLIKAIKQIALEHNISSVHFTFCSEKEVEWTDNLGLLNRKSLQYHWFNSGYATFDSFLSQLSSRKRKAIKKERITASQFDGEIIQLTGNDIEPDFWNYFWTFYQDTGSRKWGLPYLTRSFFDIIHNNMRDDILLVVAKRGEKYIAAALNFIGRETLYGRYWGCTETHSCLHYEICYYQAIEYALTHRLKKIEAGAQGEHKLSRGYLPSTTHSMHWFANYEFNIAVKRFLEEEKSFIEKEGREILSQAPFKFKRG